MLGVENMLEVEVLDVSIRVVKVVYEVLKEQGSLQTSKVPPRPIVSVTVVHLIEDGTSVYEVKLVL